MDACLDASGDASAVVDAGEAAGDIMCRFQRGGEGLGVLEGVGGMFCLRGGGRGGWGGGLFWEEGSLEGRAVFEG